VDRQGAITALVGVRMVVGVASCLTPRVAGKLFGLDSAGNPQAPYLARLFGARDVALAAGTLGSEAGAQRQWLTIGLACDLADALAGIAGGARGYLPAVTSGMVTGTALSAAALGVMALRDDAAPSAE
jgi:hypothetical protein